MLKITKKSLIMALFVFAMGAPSFAQESANKPMNKKMAATSVMNLDVGASKITWLGKKLKGEHTGTLMFKEGKFEFKGDKMVGGEIVVDMNSIKNTDLTDEGYNKKLVGHLKGEDFFDVEKNPTATFTIKSLSEVHSIVAGQPNAEAKGTLTIRGKSKPAKMLLFYTPTATGFEAKGKLEIDRTLYGVKYNSKKFFSAAALGDKLVNDVFEINLDLVAKK